MTHILARLSIAAASLMALGASQAQSQDLPYKILRTDQSLRAISREDVSRFIPMKKSLPKVRRVQTPSLEGAARPSVPQPVVLPGQTGGPVVRSTAPGPVEDEIVPQNYGRGQVSTVNHYSDNLIPPEIAVSFPYRTTGWFTFTSHDGQHYRCSAALIGRSILLTAGHCVHNGGGGDGFWIQSGSFYPAFAAGTAPYGGASSHAVFTTAGWHGSGALDEGYDVALVVLNKRSDTNTEIGAHTGWLGVCIENCLQPFWQNTQLGYPGNYYDGAYMTEGRHIEYSDSFDYRSGSGMEGGSSGGPHIANLGSLSDSSTNKGRYTRRNIAFAVTSWGTTDNSLKIQGHSSTSGPRNANRFKDMYNKACNEARKLHGPASCKTVR